jgi:predicted PurR-regulated permease PerM
MNPEISTQNQDIETMNPLLVETSPIPQKSLIPSDPKIRLLIILVTIVLILGIISIFVTIFKKPIVTNTKPLPTPTNTVIVRPTITSTIINMPENISQKFAQIDKNNQTNTNFDPPQIDTTIGQ